MKKYLLFLLMTAVGANTFAQKEGYNWYFGHWAGLTWETLRPYSATPAWDKADWLTNPSPNETIQLPSIIGTSAINTKEGCFSISTPEGEKLFYSDGVTIWNKNDVPMPNGTGLTGDASSAQSGIIIPYPGNKDKYIAFTLGEKKANNLSYTIVDMTKQSGLGDVDPAFKNVPLTGHQGLLGESVTAVRSPNHTDFWIIAVGRGTKTYLNIWKVDATGVTTACKESREIPGLNTLDDTFSSGGYIVTSPDGERWAWSSYYTGALCFGRFDPLNGTFVSVNVRLKEAGNSGNLYGVAFSQSGKYLYQTTIFASDFSTTDVRSMLYIWDFDRLLTEPPASVSYLNRFTALGPQNGTAGQFGAVVLGPDGYMYIAEAASNHLYVITDPEKPDQLKMYRLIGFLGTRLDKPNVNVGGVNYRTYVTKGLPSFATYWYSLEFLPPRNICMNKQNEYTLKTWSGAGFADLSRIEVVFGDDDTNKTVIDNPIAGNDYTINYTFPKRGLYTVQVNPYNKNGVLITADVKKYNIKVASCMIPVNHNISAMDYQ